MKYKCTGSLHVWAWTDFMRAIHGRIISYENDGNLIKSITYEVDTPIDNKILKDYYVTAEIVED